MVPAKSSGLFRPSFFKEGEAILLEGGDSRENELRFPLVSVIKKLYDKFYLS